MGSMVASHFPAWRGPWELNRMKETGWRSSQQIPALSRTSPEELKTINAEEIVHVVWIKLNQNTARNSDGFKAELLSIYNCPILFCAVYPAQTGSSSIKKAFSQLQDPIRFIRSAVKLSKLSFLLSSVSPKHCCSWINLLCFTQAPVNFSVSLYYIRTAQLLVLASLTVCLLKVPRS